MGIEVRKALLDFHEQWYSSNIMSLCIVGSESLDALESLLETLDFVAIKNKNVKRMEWLESPYGREQLGKRIEIVPIEDTRSLSIEFPIPDLRDEYKSEPARYISHLLDHEQKGSLFSELKRLGWVSSLSASTENLARGMSIFRIDITLSTGRIMEIIDMLTPSNMFYLVIAKKYAGQQGNVHEPYYGTEIHIKDIDD
ncbi:Insulin-degrading enzyme protein, partial [Trichostrongylus colubriformis]